MQAQKYCTPHLVASSEAEKFVAIPARDKWSMSNDSAYFYYCSNETIHGTQQRLMALISLQVLSFRTYLRSMQQRHSYAHTP